MKNLFILKPFILLVFTGFIFSGVNKITTKRTLQQQQLKFIQGDSGAYYFDTGLLKGTFRQSGKSTGIIPITYNGRNISAGAGLYNHYRVFTKGKRYGYGARRWPSKANLHTNGDVEVIWPVTAERPFELRAIYHWVAPNTLDVITTVHAQENLKAFEVFLASYFDQAFKASQAWSFQYSEGIYTPAFISADKTLGEWLAFPRDQAATAIINDGRWDLEPHPLAWTIMPNYNNPILLRRNSDSGITVVLMAKRKDCFGVFMPYNGEKHVSNYLSLFGYDIMAGQTAKAHSRLVVLPDPSDTEILNIANAFLNEK